MVVDNIVIHHCENFHSQTRCILFWAKKRNMQIWIGAQCAISKFWNLVRFLFFAQIRIQRVYEWKFSQWWITILSITMIFFRIFWSQNLRIQFFFGNRATCSSASVLTFWYEIPFIAYETTFVLQATPFTRQSNAAFLWFWLNIFGGNGASTAQDTCMVRVSRNAVLEAWTCIHGKVETLKIWVPCGHAKHKRT